MQIQRYIADSAQEAVQRVYNELGPDAVVVDIRKIPHTGIQGLFKNPQVEVSATLPGSTGMPFEAETSTPSQPAIPTAETVSPSSKTARTPQAAPSHTQHKDLPVLQRLDLVDDTPIEIPSRKRVAKDQTDARTKRITKKRKSGAMTPEMKQEWTTGQILEGLGLLPLNAEWVAEHTRRKFPNQRPGSLKEEFQLVQSFMVEFGDKLAARAQNRKRARKLLLGPPGGGKTTCLCKWLTQIVLINREPAKIWRLDGHMANTAELLSVHGEILDVPVERVWKREAFEDQLPQFIDLPGADPRDNEGMKTLAALEEQFRPVETLLVLNAAYEYEHLLAHSRAYGDFPISGIILTHMDEDTRWSKFWNLIIATQLPILFLSGGQELPGNFIETTPQSLFNALVDQHLGIQSEDALFENLNP